MEKSSQASKIAAQSEDRNVVDGYGNLDMEYKTMTTEDIIIGFVILHYQNINDTLDCVHSILELNSNRSARVIVVDNASPNGTGAKLADFFSDNRSVKVLCRTTNDGFSKANNEGIELAKKTWNPDFYVVSNNDVIFEQEDFLEKIVDSYDNYGFDVLGPDIYVPSYGSHQNPMEMDPPTLAQVTLTIIKNTILSLLMPFYYKRIDSRHDKGRKASSENYQSFCRDVCLKGACMIYSRKYVDEKGKVFLPETFFYYEEFIQTVYCRKNNKVIIYNPDIKVIHKDGASLSRDSKAIYFRSKYIVSNTRKAAKVYRDYLKGLI